MACNRSSAVAALTQTSSNSPELGWLVFYAQLMRLSLSLSLSLVSYALPAALVQSSSLEGHENITLLVASRSKHIY